VNDTRSVSPDSAELHRAFEQYGGQLVVHSDTSYNLAPRCSPRSGAVAIAALLMIPLAGLAARRRWAAYVVGGSLAVFAVMLVPFLFTSLADLVSISQARRRRVPSVRIRVRRGMGVLARLVGPLLIPLALGAGCSCRSSIPATSSTSSGARPAWITWFAVVGAVVALGVGLCPTTPALEIGRALAVAAFLLPVIGGGLLDLRPRRCPQIATLTADSSPLCARTFPRSRRLLRPGDELPARGVRTGLHRIRATGARR
jgi:hypothetical protein